MASQNRTHASDRGKAILDIPTVPTIGTATKYFDGATVAFTPSTKGGAATSYTVLSNPGSITATGTTSPITISGLTLNTAYTFTIRANNAQGSSEYSSASNSITPTDPAPVEYLIIAGGGNGSISGTNNGQGGGGGSGGQVLTNSAYGAPRATALSITVGGGNSSSSFNSITAAPGYYSTPSNNIAGAGAGGAADGRTPGPGIASSITGTLTRYAGGGGAGSPSVGSGAARGGVDGGGTGGQWGGSINGFAGTPNTGGGGGGGGFEDIGDGQYIRGQGGAGGSGVVVIAYPSYVGAATISGGLTYDQPTRTGYRVYRFTAGTGTITIPS